MKEDLLPIVAHPDPYHQRFSFGFGVWMDENWRKYGWNTNDFSKNYFTPDAFAASVGAALHTTDEYVWIYSETPRWWSDHGTPVKLPAAYEEALRRARAAPGK
jgi:hypothetical protein